MGILFFVIIGALAVFKLGQSLIDNPSLFLQQVINGLQLGFVYALIALGYTMVYGIVRLINFAHGDVFMVGAFTSFYAIARFQFALMVCHFISGSAGICQPDHRHCHSHYFFYGNLRAALIHH